MSNRVDVDVEGFQALANKLKELANDKDKKREALIVLRQVAKPTLQASQSKAPVSKQKHFSRGKYIAPGTLKKSLGFITVKTENPTIVVGPRAKRNFDGWYGHFVHEGHEYVAASQKPTKLFYKNNARFTTVRNVSAGSAKNKGRKSKMQRAELRALGAYKRTKPQPFLTDAYDQTKGKVTAEAEVKFANFLERRIKKLSN